MSDLPILLTTHPLHPAAFARLRGAFRVVEPAALDDASLIAAARDAELMIVRAPLPKSIFAASPRLRAAIRHGAGLDMVPLPEATKAGVLVTNVPGANARTVAEHVMMVSMMLMRQYRCIDQEWRGGHWHPARARAEQTGELHGQTLGIIGYGAIGQAVASMAVHGFGMRVLGFRASSTPMPEHVKRATVDEVLAQSDIVVLACPLNDETRGMINHARLGRMKRSAFLINVARGPVIVEADLIAALQAGQIAGAALDVFDTQPLPPNHAYRAMQNVVLTPHIAGITAPSMERIALTCAEQALAILEGKIPRFLVNPDAMPHYRTRFPD